jgi:hypothetical protein
MFEQNRDKKHIFRQVRIKDVFNNTNGGKSNVRKGN